MKLKKPIPFILNAKKYKKEAIEAYYKFFNMANGIPVGFIMYTVQIDCDPPSFEAASCPLVINKIDQCLEVIQTIMMKANFVQWI